MPEHTEHCKKRMKWGDGECECRSKMTEKERLFNYFYQEHGITLLESQLDDVLSLCKAHFKDEAVEAANNLLEITATDAEIEIVGKVIKAIRGL